MLAVLAGAVLMSYHQPFISPGDAVIALAPAPVGRGWRAIHILSASCGCSQRVMRHLLARKPLEGAEEQVVLIEGLGEALEGSEAMAATLERRGVAVRRLRSAEIGAEVGLKGVPLLALVSPAGGPVYLGGYGTQGDQDDVLFRQVQAGERPRSLPIVGCAAGIAAMRQADPFGFKYGRTRLEER